MKHTLKVLTALLLVPLATLHATGPDLSKIMKTSSRRTVSLLMFAVTAMAGLVLTSAFAGDAAAQSVPKGLRVASPFSDHMVLQREMVVPVWGEAVPGAAVEVAFAGQTKTATANEQGRWMVKLERLDTSADGRELTVACGGSKTVFKDVVVGEVWFASGQSNMQMALIDTEGGPEAVKNSADPLLRGLVQGYDSAPAPLDFSKNPPAWELASAETLHKQPTNPNTRPQWSAVAYHMARKLRAELKVPVGIVMASSGATPAQTWTAPEGNAFSDELKDDQSPHLQYNAMIHPLVPYAIRGAIWYQGENNIRQAGETAFYEERFKALVGGWRKVWGQGDFPVYAVELAPCSWYGDAALAEWCEAMIRATRKIPNTGLVVSNDLTLDYGDIHPKKKREAGERLALLALGKTYGVSLKAHGSPEYQSVSVEGNAVKLKFGQVGEGLKSRDGQPLVGFEVAGDKFNETTRDYDFFPAVATAAGDTITLRSDQVPHPFTARYAWKYSPQHNAVNSEGLPVNTFRTKRPPVLRAITLGWKASANSMQPQGDGFLPENIIMDKQHVRAWSPRANHAPTDVASWQVTFPTPLSIKGLVLKGRRLTFEVQALKGDDWETVAKYVPAPEVIAASLKTQWGETAADFKIDFDKEVSTTALRLFFKFSDTIPQTPKISNGQAYLLAPFRVITSDGKELTNPTGKNEIIERD